jgi:DHA1 family bicyclomycin/chloramphenicol resistance-like MFS transporter
MVPMVGIMIGIAMVMPNAQAGAIAPFAHMAGAAAALMGFMQMAMASLVGVLIAGFANGTALPMILSLLITQTLGLAARLVLIHRAP